MSEEPAEPSPPEKAPAPPMDAEALAAHRRTFYATVLPGYDPGPAPWHVDTPCNWYRLPVPLSRP